MASPILDLLNNKSSAGKVKDAPEDGLEVYDNSSDSERSEGESG